jgi:hypothetical protein
MQATRRPGVISRNTGTVSAQAAIACGQRVRNTQPDGGDVGLGSSPDAVWRDRFPPWIDGVAAISARV